MFNWRKKQFNLDRFEEDVLETLKEKLYNEVKERNTLDGMEDISQKLLRMEVDLVCQDPKTSNAIIRVFKGTIYEKSSAYGSAKQASASLMDHLFVTTRINSDANRYVRFKFNE